MIMMITMMAKKRVFDANRCPQNLGPDNKVYDGGDDDDSDGVRNDDRDGGDYGDDDHDDQDDEEDGV